MYQFPRVTIFLDPENLELTPEAQTELTSAMAEGDSKLLEKFLNDYGNARTKPLLFGFPHYPPFIFK